MKFLMFVAPCAAVITKPTSQKAMTAMKPVTKLSVKSAVSKALIRTALTTAARITLMTDITELAQSLKAEDISSERMEWLKKLADMEYCASNPGHWLMNLKETNYLASLALQCLESNSTLVEALENAQRRIAELESRTVKLPHRNLGHPKLFLLCPFPYYDAEDMEKALAAAGIKVEDE
ncbi:hypothetical protein POU90_23435 [Klebsiella pneumoniae]|uniref:hypothetical protein n=1 Tax=Klebsiella pneumoniae TaxID=573 RepID=UPI0015F2EE30|nr:hypothetical protein [Klebsiella pneumoniae]HDY9179182.1 hypothetical protein [Klebsiella pneumoniae]HDY9187188.1 hypothetical protein [Klebsiella pneumoniae]